MNGQKDNATWEDELNDRITEILDRKRSSYEGRELAYAIYIRLLLDHYARDELEGRTKDLAGAFLRSIRSGSTEKETLLATRALALTIITDPTEDLFDQTVRPLKTALTDHQSHLVKTIIIYTLAIACPFYISTVETESLMTFFLDIISSEGATVNAEASSEVIAASIQAWGFLLSTLHEPEALVEEAMEFLVDALDNPSVDVQIAAGEVIALIYEMSYVEETGDNEEVMWSQRFTPYGRVNDLLNTLSTLTTGSKRYLNKRNRKTQHSAFHDILRGVEDPVGNNGSMTGHANRQTLLKLRLRNESTMAIDEWSKLLRLQSVRRLLQSGFQKHMMENDVFFRRLDLTMDNGGEGASYKGVRSKPRGKKARWGVEEVNKGGFLSD